MERMSLEQQRARAALRRHGRYPPSGDAFWRDYASAANGLPPRLRINGFLLGLSSAHAQLNRDAASPADHAVLADLGDWLVRWGRDHGCGLHGLENVPLALEDRERLEPVRKALQALQHRLLEIEDQRALMVIEQEALAYLAWLKALAAGNKPLDRETASEEPASEHRE